MLASQIPAAFPIPFAADAGGGFTNPIPESSQIGITAGAASLHDGFPPVTFLQIGAGGTPPWGRDMNGILNQVSAWNQWQSMGGPVYWSSSLSSAIAGYPYGAIVAQGTAASPIEANWWLSIEDNNTDDPTPGTSPNWIGFGLFGVARIVTTSGAFSVNLGDGTIGLKRSTSLAPSSSTLPSNPPMAKAYYIEDLIGNFSQYPVTIAAPAGQNISGLTSVTLTTDRSCARFTYYGSGSNQWSVRF